MPETPEQIIRWTVTEGDDREQMIHRLVEYPYTYGDHAPYPGEGSTSGTWDQVRDAMIEGLLTESEFQRISALTANARATTAAELVARRRDLPAVDPAAFRQDIDDVLSPDDVRITEGEDGQPIVRGNLSTARGPVPGHWNDDELDLD